MVDLMWNKKLDTVFEKWLHMKFPLNCMLLIKVPVLNHLVAWLCFLNLLTCILCLVCIYIRTFFLIPVIMTGRTWWLSCSQPKPRFSNSQMLLIVPYLFLRNKSSCTYLGFQFIHNWFIYKFHPFINYYFETLEIFTHSLYIKTK